MKAKILSNHNLLTGIKNHSVRVSSWLSLSIWPWSIKAEPINAVSSSSAYLILNTLMIGFLAQTQRVLKLETLSLMLPSSNNPNSVGFCIRREITVPLRAVHILTIILEKEIRINAHWWGLITHLRSIMPDGDLNARMMVPTTDVSSSQMDLTCVLAGAVALIAQRVSENGPTLELSWM